MSWKVVQKLISNQTIRVENVLSIWDFSLYLGIMIRSNSSVASFSKLPSGICSPCMYWTNNVFRLFKTCLWPWSFKTLNLKWLGISLWGSLRDDTGREARNLNWIRCLQSCPRLGSKASRRLTTRGYSTRAWWPSFLVTHDADISVTCQVNELLYLVDLLTYSLPAQKTLVVFKMLRREHSKALCQILVVLTLLDALASLQTSQPKRRTYDGWVIKKC